MLLEIPNDCCTAQSGHRHYTVHTARTSRVSVSITMRDKTELCKFAKELVEIEYGIKVDRVRQLPSYQDHNFHILPAKQSQQSRNVLVDGYVLKIFNPKDSLQTALFRGITEIFDYLNKRNIKVPSAIKSLQGFQYYLRKNDFEQSSQMIQLLSFLPGTTLGKATTNFDVLYSLMHQCGQFYGKFNRELQGLKIPEILRPNSTWNTQELLNKRSDVNAIREEEVREMGLKVCSEFETKIYPEIPHLRRGIIHGDGNAGNIIVSCNNYGLIDSPSSWSVEGLIDFGDVMHSCYLFEIGNLTTYMIVYAFQRGADMNTAAARVIRGYDDQMPLLDLDKQLLFEAVTSRIVLSLSVANRESQLHPDNAETILADYAAMKNILLYLLKSGKSEICRIWFKT